MNGRSKRPYTPNFESNPVGDNQMIDDPDGVPGAYPFECAWCGFVHTGHTHCGDCGVELATDGGGYQFCPLCLDVMVKRHHESAIVWELSQMEDQFVEDLLNEGPTTP